MNHSLTKNELLSVYFFGTFLYSLSLYYSLRDSFTRRDLQKYLLPSKLLTHISMHPQASVQQHSLQVLVPRSVPQL
jgi:hypothetical protein